MSTVGPNDSFPIRYDVAHELEITLDNHGETYVKVFDCGIASVDGSSAQSGVNTVTPERIPLLFQKDHFFSVIFLKQN